MIGGRRWAVLAVLCGSLLVVAMDATILNVALPSLIEDLRPDAVQQLWIIDVYGLILGGLLVTAGAIGDRWGRRRLFLLGFVMFGVASVVSATATTPWTLVGGRVLLGVGGAMVMPSTLSLIRNVFTDDRERAFAIGVWAAVAGAGAAIGPIVGGVLVQAYGWSSAFWLNVPVVVVVVVAGLILLPEYREPSPAGLDWLSAGLSVAGMIVLVWGIKHIAKDGLSSPAPIAFLVGLALLIWFARRQLTLRDPLLDVRLFTDRTFLGAALATLFVMMGVGCALYLVSLWFQYVHGLTPLQAGVRLLPLALVGLVAALSAPALLGRFGARPVMVAGLAAIAVGFVLVALTQNDPVFHMSYLKVGVALGCFGLGEGLAITSASAVMMSAAPPERAGSAAAVEETSYELGVGFGVALLGSIAAAAYRSHLPKGVLGPARESIGGAVEAAHRIGGEPARVLLRAASTAFDDALVTTAEISVGLTAISLLLVFWLVPRGFKATSAH